MNNKNSYLSLFEKSSFKYTEKFNFGTDIIFNDINKVCNIEIDAIKKIFRDKTLNKELNQNDILEEKYFIGKNFRKIKKQLIIDIVNSRVEEILNIFINKNINSTYLKKGIKTVFFSIEDGLISENFSKNFQNFLSSTQFNDICLINNFRDEELFNRAAFLITHGWKKEAVPITVRKNSLITRIFKYLFE